MSARSRRRWYRRIVLRSFAIEVNDSIEFTDDTVDMLEDRITALEELVFARWPRSWLLRRRLARELRASAARVDAFLRPAERARQRGALLGRRHDRRGIRDDADQRRVIGG
jgi:hypothetical protein